MGKFLALFFSLLFCMAFLGQTSSRAEEVVEVPIIMYHSVLKSKKGMYSVHPSLLREDIRYLKNHGYQPIFVKDIIAFCEGKGDLPQKPVVLSFDDGHYNNYYYAYPILKEENFKANLNVVGSYCNYSTTSGDYDNPNYSYLTWREIKELYDSNIFEIGNHTYKMHAFSPRYGIKQKLYESDDEYAKALKDDVSKLEYKFMVECGFRTEVFAYPFGAYSDLGEKILREMGFKAFLTCNEGINKLKRGDAKALSHLKRVNRSGNLTTYQFFQKLKSC